MHLYARTPIVRLHRGVGGEADFENAGKFVETIDDDPVKRFDFCVLVAGCLRVDVRNVPVPRIQFHVYVLCLVEALRKEACGDEQHEGERGLEDNECALQQGGARRGGTRIGA